MINIRKHTLAPVLAMLAGVSIVLASFGYAFAGHNGADVTVTPGSCGETTFSAEIIDPNGTHKVDNMQLVVSVDGNTYTEVIPTDGTSADITVGPFFEQTASSKTISWRVFGGSERDYDQPLWNGYGSTTFNSDIAAYADDVGGFDWVVSGTDDPNPFTNWNEVDVMSCELTKDMCKKGGWEDHGFRNQGQCIRYVNTGQDSR